jgi:uncharacterized OB-fold protein
MRTEGANLMPVLKPHPEGIPAPIPTALSQPFWDGCAHDELLFQRCTTCGRANFNPAPVCRWCTSPDLAWTKSTGLGRVYSWTVVWRPQTPAFEVPYVPAIIDVDEGYQMIANVIGCEPDALEADMRVEAEFHPIGNGIVLPYFRPLPDGGSRPK